MLKTIPPMIDPFGRRITYLRVSVTDRCDFRCVYCMAESPTFLPRKDLLTLEEIDRLASAFIAKGVRKVRLTGSELARYAGLLANSGIGRINVSLNTLDAAKFKTITRWGDLAQVMAGIDEADRAGIKIKINTVALRGVSEDEIEALLRWAHGRGFDLTLIETMPMGETGSDRTEQYLPLSLVRARLQDRFTLEESPHRSGGPARYVQVRETGGRLGFITPLTHNFCEACNRVRVTCTGTLYMCLGQEDSADLRAPLRASESDHLLNAAIDAAIAAKPKGHDFVIERDGKPALSRTMSRTGG